MSRDFWMRTFISITDNQFVEQSRGNKRLISSLPWWWTQTCAEYGLESVILYLVWVMVSLFPLYNAPWTDYATFHHGSWGRPVACVVPVGSSGMSLVCLNFIPPSPHPPNKWSSYTPQTAKKFRGLLHWMSNEVMNQLWPQDCPINMYRKYDKIR